MNTNTIELFYKDLYMFEFDATVLKVNKLDNYYEIILDRTCFYPEGGGQYGDKGNINGIDVIDTYIKDNNIVHLATSFISENTNVHCKVDFDRRYQNMQSHSGEHIISGIVNSLYGYSNVGFHMNDNVITIDYDGKLDLDELYEIEVKANSIITKNLPINELYFSNSEKCSLNYRSKKRIDGTLRLINIPGIDICACCGTHTKSTSEIGLIHFIGLSNYKNGVRITAVVGNNAIRYIIRQNKILNNLYSLTSSNIDSLIENTNSLYQKFESLKEKNIFLERTLSNFYINNYKEIDNIRYILDIPLSKDNIFYMINNIDYEGYFIVKNDNFIVIKYPDSYNELVNYLRKNNIIKGGGSKNTISGKLLVEFNELIESLRNYSPIL